MNDRTAGTLQGSIPDLGWINRSLPIADVAKALGLRVEGNMIQCWHPERHQHGDRTPSVGIRKTTNRAKCFGCDTRPIGVVDLVVDVLRIDLKEAIRWIEEHFEVKRIPKGKHLESRSKEHPYRVGYERPVELLVKSGIWATFGPQTQRIVPVLLAFAERAEKNTLVVTSSYRRLMRFSGVKSPNSISKGTRQLEEIGWLEIHQTKTPDGSVLKNVNTYILTPESDAILELANGMASQLRAEIAAERELRKQRRRARKEALSAATLCVSGNLDTRKARGCFY